MRDSSQQISGAPRVSAVRLSPNDLGWIVQARATQGTRSILHRDRRVAEAHLQQQMGNLLPHGCRKCKEVAFSSPPGDPNRTGTRCPGSLATCNSDQFNGFASVTSHYIALFSAS